MKLTVAFEGLENCVRQMGATKRVWVPNEVIRQFLETREELEKGIESTLDQIDITNGGLIAHKGQQVVLYIKDHTYNSNVLNDSKDGNRVHLCDCHKLKKMRQDGRFGRYVSTVKTGNFPIDVADPVIKTVLSHLYVCIYCLEQMNLIGPDSKKWNISREFDFVDFFARFSTFFALPTQYNDYSAPNSTYTADWYKRSNEIREKSGWKCVECGVFLGEAKHKKLLHVHHKNGVKANNSARNLVSLCEIDHARQPSHQHMQVSASNRELILRLRKLQGL